MKTVSNIFQKLHRNTKPNKSQVLLKQSVFHHIRLIVEIIWNILYPQFCFIKLYSGYQRLSKHLFQIHANHQIRKAELSLNLGLTFIKPYRKKLGISGNPFQIRLHVVILESSLNSPSWTAFAQLCGYPKFQRSLEA